MEPGTRLDKLPAEILLCIFDWICEDEIGLSLLAVSRSLRAVLLSHPVSQTLGAFQIQYSKNVVRVVNRSDSSAISTTPTYRDSLCQVESAAIVDIIGRRWCKPQFISQFQKALMRSMIKKHWTPNLRRDGRVRNPKDIKNILDQLTLLTNGTTELKPGGMITITDSIKEYSWTRIHVWPLDGRVIIRDQVLNTCLELHVPIVSHFQLARLASDIECTEGSRHPVNVLVTGS